MRLNRQSKKYLNYGLIGFALLLAYTLFKKFAAGSGQLFDLFKAGSSAAASGSTPTAYEKTYGTGIDVDKVETVIDIVNKSIYGWGFFSIQFDTDVLNALGSLSTVAEVKYASAAFKSKYGESLKARVTTTLPSWSVSKIPSLVQMNWT